MSSYGEIGTQVGISFIASEANAYYILTEDPYGHNHQNEVDGNGVATYFANLPADEFTEVACEFDRELARRYPLSASVSSS